MTLRYSAARALGLFLLLSCSHTSLVLAHGAQADEHHGNMDQEIGGKPSYFSLSDHVGLLYTHIALMIVAWVVILPVAVMLSIVTSRYTISIQVAFVVTNILGLVTALSYNARSPDLYPNNAHHKIGWIITNVVTVQILLGAIARGRSCHADLSNREQTDGQSFMPLRTTVDDNDYVDEPQDYRHSDERSRGNSIELLESQSKVSETTQVDSGNEHELLTARKTLDGSYPRHRGSLSAVIHFVRTLPKTLFSKGLWYYVALFYKSTDRIILPFGFIAITTGIITMGRFFEGDGFFNGLAHWIKGGVFFWLGLFNLGRWAGSFADLGWAWNMRPRRFNRRSPPSAEFMESFLIFFYGSTNIFLEHLGNTDGKWTAQDLEHIAITVLFIGGGLCGMLVESVTVRNLLNAAVHTDASSDGNSVLSPPRSYEFSLNPIPALVICLLGIMMGSHHQTSMISTMVHKQWGNLLFGASFSRCLTYILMYLRPPSSALPSRPPTELLTAFGLIAGGIIFMASSRDTVDGMVRNDLDAMLFYTVTMGMVGILMAWEVVVLALKGLAFRKENRYTFNH